MSCTGTILIADRNPRVRQFLKREITAEGYRVRLAGSAREVLESLRPGVALDLLVLDPELPDADAVELLERIASRTPPLPVVCHALDSQQTDLKPCSASAAFVEKSADSVESLKRIIHDLLSVPPA